MAMYVHGDGLYLGKFSGSLRVSCTRPMRRAVMKPWSLTESLGPKTVAGNDVMAAYHHQQSSQAQGGRKSRQQRCQKRTPCIAKCCSDEQVA
jgi:hypothetical protein